MRPASLEQTSRSTATASTPPAAAADKRGTSQTDYRAGASTTKSSTPKSSTPKSSRAGESASGSAESAAAPSESAASSASPDNAKKNDVAPDNTKKNERDRDSAALTPMDQNNNQTDLKITQQIRQAVMADSSLSFTAKNVKIITQNGRVTLRGPVKTADERSAIEAAARRVAGAIEVDNQIEVKK